MCSDLLPNCVSPRAPTTGATRRTPLHFKLYQDNSGDWRWTLYAANHKKIANSAEGYVDKADTKHGIELVRGAGVRTPIRE